MTRHENTNTCNDKVVDKIKKHMRVDKMCGKFASEKLSGNIEIGPYKT